MLFEAVLLSLLLGFLLGGKIERLGDVKIQKWWLIFCAFAVELVGEQLLASNGIGVLVFNYTWLLMLIQYAILMWFIYENWELDAIKIFFIGTALNFFVIMANGGFMPVALDMAKHYDFSQTQSALSEGLIFGHLPVSSQTVLVFLSDIFHLPPPYIYPQTFSLGDIVIDVGVMLFIIHTMISGEERKVSV